MGGVDLSISYMYDDNLVILHVLPRVAAGGMTGPHTKVNPNRCNSW